MSHTSLVRFGRRLVVAALMLGLLIAAPDARSAGSFPGGFLEKATSGEVRPRPGAAALSRLLPSRGGFTFPSPWNTEGVRLTNGADCEGTDCVIPVGYSYCRNMNNHAGSDTMLIFLGLDAAHGGPTLFGYNKITDEVKKHGPLFDASDPLSGATGEGWYFSATRPHALYVNSGSRMYRYDVSTRKKSLVYDAASQLGGGVYIWQMHSSDDDRVHVATVRSSSTFEMMGCIAYREDAQRFTWHPARGRLDECHIDKAGRFLVMLDNVDGADGEDNRIIDLSSGRESVVMDREGAAGHADMGYGYMVNEDNWASEPEAVRLRRLGSNARARLPHERLERGRGPHLSRQRPAGGSSNATRTDYPRSNEIVCYRLDGSMDVLVVAIAAAGPKGVAGGAGQVRSIRGRQGVRKHR